MHVHLRLRLLTTFTVMAKDPLQSVEAPILRALYQVNITESSGGENIETTEFRRGKSIWLHSHFFFNSGTAVNRFMFLLSVLLPAIHTNYKRSSQNEVDRTSCLTPRPASGHSNIFCCLLWWFHGSICTKSAPSCKVHYLKAWEKKKKDQPVVNQTREFRCQRTNELPARFELKVPSRMLH